MSSRSIGVTKVEFSRLMMSWVIRSPSCSALTISRERPVSSGQAPIISVEQARSVDRVLAGLDEEVEEGAIAGQEGEAHGWRHPSDCRGVPPRSAGGRGELLGGAGRVALAQLLLDAAPLAVGGLPAGSSHPPASSSQALALSAKQRSSTSSSSARRAGSSTGVTSSTRLSRLRGIRSAEPIRTRVSSPRWKA